ncbi:hypothetical protein Tcan_00691, partial [Toxocara canis]
MMSCVFCLILLMIYFKRQQRLILCVSRSEWHCSCTVAPINVHCVKNYAFGFQRFLGLLNQHFDKLVRCNKPVLTHYMTEPLFIMKMRHISQRHQLYFTMR